MNSLGTKRVPKTKQQAVEISLQLRDTWRVYRQPTQNMPYPYPNLTRAARFNSDITNCMMQLIQMGEGGPVLQTLIERLCTPVTVLKDQSDFQDLAITLQSAMLIGRRRNLHPAANVAKDQPTSGSNDDQVLVTDTETKTQQVSAVA